MLKASELHLSIADIEHYSRKELSPDKIHEAYAIFHSKGPILLAQLKELI